ADRDVREAGDAGKAGLDSKVRAADSDIRILETVAAGEAVVAIVDRRNTVVACVKINNSGADGCVALAVERRGIYGGIEYRSWKAASRIGKAYCSTGHSLA